MHLQNIHRMAHCLLLLLLTMVTTSVFLVLSPLKCSAPDKKSILQFRIILPVDISTLSEAEFNEELEKGYADMQAGRTKNAKKAFADIRKDYGL